MDELTHVDERGRARMVDVGAKTPLRRRAVAEATLHAREDALDRLFAGDLPKGEALAVARIAGISAAKRTDELIPLCHGLPLDHVGVGFERASAGTVRILAEASTVSRTGVEMEALTAATVAGLTLWDMLKAVDPALRLDGVVLLEKTKKPLVAEDGGRDDGDDDGN